MKNPNKIKSTKITNLFEEGVENPKPLSVEMKYQVAMFPADIRTIYKIDANLKSKKSGIHDVFDIQVFVPEDQEDPEKPMSFSQRISDMDKFIDELKSHFMSGRYKIGPGPLWRTLPNATSYRITYAGIRKLLAFELRASRFPQKKDRAIQNTDPRMINRMLDCGEYLIESWWLNSNRRYYTTITFNDDIAKWIVNETNHM